MPRRTRRAARLAAFLGIPAALIASGVFISTASYSAFSATTQTSASNWTTGNVALSNDLGTALFTVTGLKPGINASRCIVVTSTGSLPASVKLYASSPSAANALSGALLLTIEQGSGSTGGTGSCTNFAPDATGTIFTAAAIDGFAAKTGYGAGIGTWNPAGGVSESKTYRITYSLPSTAPSTAQGLTTQLGFTWESQNT